MRVELSPEILVYTGRARGREDRRRFGLDVADANGEVVNIVVPQTVYTMTSSYFLALLGDSIRRLGREEFAARYRFDAPEHVVRKIDDWISRAVREKRGLFGGDAP